MLEGSERVMRGVLAQLPAGEWRAEDFLDDDGVRRGRIGIRVAVRNDPAKKHAVVDFNRHGRAGCGQHQCGLCDRMVGGVLCLPVPVPADALATAGLMRPVRVIAAEGTVVNAVSPAAVAGGTWRLRSASWIR